MRTPEVRRCSGGIPLEHKCICSEEKACCCSRDVHGFCYRIWRAMDEEVGEEANAHTEVAGVPAERQDGRTCGWRVQRVESLSWPSPPRPFVPFSFLSSSGFVVVVSGALLVRHVYVNGGFVPGQSVDRCQSAILLSLAMLTLSSSSSASRPMALRPRAHDRPPAKARHTAFTPVYQPHQQGDLTSHTWCRSPDLYPIGVEHLSDVACDGDQWTRSKTIEPYAGAQRGHHLLDPKTAYPSPPLTSNALQTPVPLPDLHDVLQARSRADSFSEEDIGDRYAVSCC